MILKKYLGRKLNFILKRIGYNYGDYNIRVIKNNFKNIIYHNPDHKYLFILSAPLSGSTVLNEILSTSKFVSTNNDKNTREGQQLPSVKEIMYTNSRWDNAINYDWHFIKKEWRKYWDLSAKILLDKSPPNILRALEIEKVFQPSYFIILFRDPYAVCEGLIRRRNYRPKEAAEFITNSFKYQKMNIEGCKLRFIIKYEDLCENPLSIKEGLINLLPELSDISFKKQFSAHNIRSEKLALVNLNSEKINRLSRNQIDEMNSVFEKNVDLLKYFNYDIL